MTIQQAMETTQKIKPNAVPRAVQVLWLDELDRRIFAEIVKTHQYGENLEFTGYDPAAEDTDDIVLLAPDPYSMVYIHWLCSKIDLQNQEYDIYQNDAALYNGAYRDYRNFYNRLIMPAQPATIGTSGKVTMPPKEPESEEAGENAAAET